MEKPRPHAQEGVPFPITPRPCPRNACKSLRTAIIPEPPMRPEDGILRLRWVCLKCRRYWWQGVIGTGAIQ